MLARLKIRTRIVVGFLFLIALVCLLLMPYLFTSMQSLIERAEERELHDLAQEFQQKIADEQQLAIALAGFVARLPDVQSYLRNDDKAGLQQALSSAFTYLKEQNGLRQFHFHRPPATSYLRVHKPARSGDDLSGFRETVVVTNRDKAPVAGLEKGVAGLGIRGIAPISVAGQHWGSVEFGFALGQLFLDDFKQKAAVDVAIYTEQGGRLVTSADTLSEPLLSQSTLTRVLAGEGQRLDADWQGKKLAVLALPLADFSGRPVAVISLAMDRSGYLDRLNNALYSSLLAGVVFLLIALVIAVWVARSILKPVNEMRLAMENIVSGDGDLTRRLSDAGNNELGDIARTFNQFVENIESLVTALMHSIASVSNSGSELFDQTERTLKIVSAQQSRTDEVATAVDEMTATAREVAGNAENASMLTQTSHEQSRQGYETVNESIKTINELAENVASTVTLVGQVNQQSGHIHTILDVIQSIAEQTNLLALNAAIEAARAGEQGRGFAVVADEVRSLAARTQNSTSEINQMITQLQQGTTHTVSVIEQSQQQAAKTVQDAGDSGEVLQSIRAAMEHINDAVTQIASAAEQQSQVAETINQSVVDIADGAGDVASGARHIMTTSSHIGTELNELMTIVRRFKVHKDPAIELAVARSAHQAWKMRLRAFLDGHGSLRPEQAVSHRECDFGQWYYGAGASVCQQIPALTELEAPHERMHYLIGQIIEANHAGQKAKAEQLYQQVCELSDTIVAGMEQAITQV